LPEVNKVESALERLRKLLPDHTSGGTKVDENESRRRAELIALASPIDFLRCLIPDSSPRSSLMEVEIVLQSLSDRLAEDDYKVTAGDRQIVSDLIGDIRDATREYQVSGVCPAYTTRR
jgi:hypothetical protein